MEISIIGGGITGLTTALALHKLGLKATVYEQAKQLNELGAGVWLQPNAVQIFRWLGLFEKLQRQGVILNKMEITASDLTPYKKIKQKVVQDALGNSTLAIHRGKLQRILFEEFSQVGAVELGARYLSHSTENSQTAIQLSSKKVFSDLVIGADGIHSNVRTAMNLPSVYRSTQQICCRGIAHAELPAHLLNEGKEMWGNKKRFGFSRIGENQVYFFAVINQSICPPNLTPSTLSTIFSNFHPVVKSLIKNTEQLHIAELKDLKRLPKWYNENCCLVGDAAHATTPNMGQGACQGIEDAYYLSNLICKSKKPLSHLLLEFETKRRKKVDYVVNNSWQFGQMAHTPWKQAIVKTMMKITPEKVIHQQMNKLYQLQQF